MANQNIQTVIFDPYHFSLECAGFGKTYNAFGDEILPENDPMEVTDEIGNETISSPRIPKSYDSIVATDGSLIPRRVGVPGGYVGAGIVILRKSKVSEHDELTIISVPLPDVEDINVAEITAATIALEYIDPDDNCEFLTDSQELLRSLSKYYNEFDGELKPMPRFRNQNVADIYGATVLLFNALAQRTGCVVFKKVTSHTGIKLNDDADAAALTAATSVKLGKYDMVVEVI